MHEHEELRVRRAMKIAIDRAACEDHVGSRELRVKAKKAKRRLKMERKDERKVAA